MVRKDSSSVAPSLRIYTLGRFSVEYGDRVITEERPRAHLLWLFFRYLLLRRDRMVPENELIDVLWPEVERSYPKNALRNLSARLSSLLAEAGCETPRPGYVLADRGYYGFNWESEYWFDVEAFSNLCAQAEEKIASEDPETAMGLLREAVSLYAGDYHFELSYEDWVLLPRNHYRNLYVKAVSSLMNDYMCRGLHSAATAIGFTALGIEPFDEALHELYIQALIELKRYQQALSHYQHASSVMYRKIGIKPSAKMQELYRTIKKGDLVEPPEKEGILESLKDLDSSSGALLCSREIFRTLYKLEERRVERLEKPSLLITLTLTMSKGVASKGQMTDELEGLAEAVLLNSLRKGDVVCRWGRERFLILLPGVTRDQGQVVLQRIEAAFDSHASLKECSRHFTADTVRPLEPGGEQHM